MKKVLLINTSSEDLYKKAKINVAMSYMIPPLTLVTLAAPLVQKGHEVKICDLNLSKEPKQELDRILHSFNPDYVGISFMTASFNQMILVTEEIKKFNKNIIVIGGGPHASNDPIETLTQSKLDIAVVGEGDFTLVEIISGKNLETVEGIAYRNHLTHKIKINPKRKLIDNLDDLPMPAWDLINIKDYKLSPLIRRKLPVGAMETCYDDKTEVLTEDGWKFFSNLKKTDKVATLNPKTKELEYHNPKEIIKRDYIGEAYLIDTKYLNLLITPNHKIYVKRNQRNTDFKLVEIKDVYDKTKLQFKRDAIWKGDEKKYFILPGVKHRFNIINGKQENMPLKISMDAWLEFLGYYLSEGSCGKKKNNIYRIKIDQSSKVNKKKYDKIEKCIKKLGYSYYRNKDYFEISNKQLYTYLKRFGKCYQKYIPKEMKQLSSRQLRILLEALILGDGYVFRSGRKEYISTSKQLIDDIQEIALKMGCSSNYNLKKTSKKAKIRGRLIKSKHKCYYVYITNTRNTPTIKNYKTRRKINKVQYNGKIYCCEVKNHIIYVRRNGRPVWCGNSRGCPFGCIYCSKSVCGRSFRAKSSERVLKETEQMLNLGFKEIQVVDDLFSADMERAKKICDEIKKRKLDFVWNLRSGIRIDRIDEELVNKLVDSGCYRTSFGLESGNQEILNSINKGITLDQVRDVFKYIKNYNIETLGFFMIALPKDTEKTMQDTIDFALEIDPTIAKATITTPFPGTSLFDYYDNLGRIKSRDWSQYFSHDPSKVYDHPTLSWDTIFEYYNKFYRSFYFRPKFAVRRLVYGIRNKTLIYDAKSFLSTKW